MKLLKNKIWKWWDISLLKWCCLLYGVLVGAWLSEPVMRHAGWVLVAAIILTIRPAIAYWRD